MSVAGGATRAALIQHQARRDNMADVAAKDGSQVQRTYIISASDTIICPKGHQQHSNSNSLKPALGLGLGLALVAASLPTRRPC